MTPNKRMIALLVLFLLFLSALLYHSTIFLPPSFVHAWTQSERYAIALRFLDNGFDLFHPATFNLQTTDGITRMDLPLNEFIVALLMKITGSTSPFIFRAYMLALSITGLVFLYLLAKRITCSELKSWLCVLFVFLSPVYTYYQPGFIPCVPAISLTFIAYYFLYRYKEEDHKKHFVTAVLFFVLAALIRTPFAIFLIALILQQGFLAVRRKKIITYEWLALFFGIAVFFAWYRHGVHLGYIYGNMFLDTFLPARNFSDFTLILKEIWNVWIFQYFTVWHYLFLIVLLVLVARRFRPVIAGEPALWFNLLIAAGGAVLYFLLMSAQYFDHDYYFLDSLFVPFVLLFLLSMQVVPLQKEWHTLGFFFVMAISAFFMYGDSRKNQFARYKFNDWDRVEISRRNFLDADKFLDSVGISRDARMLVIEAYSTNIPLYSMKRKGYTVYQTSRDNAAFALHRYPWDFVVIQDRFLFSDVLKYFPVTAYMIEPIAWNGKISIYGRAKEFRRRNLSELLQLDKREKIFSQTNGYEEPEMTQSEFVTFDRNSRSHWGVLGPGTEYGINSNVFASGLKGKKRVSVLASVRIKAADHKGLKMVITVKNEQKTLFYADYLVAGVPGAVKEFYCPLPPFRNANDMVSVYLWNSEKKNVLYDDLSVTIYAQ